jgi:hypothetical protein
MGEALSGTPHPPFLLTTEDFYKSLAVLQKLFFGIWCYKKRNATIFFRDVDSCMKFKNWLEVQMAGLQAPTAGNYLKTAALGAGKAIASQFVGTAMDIASTVNQLWQMRQKGQDLTPLIMKMMQQQDQGGAPANAFDLDDDVAAMLSEPSKIEIAREIVMKIDQLIAQARAGKISPQAANIIAVNYIQRKVGPLYQKLKQSP